METYCVRNNNFILPDFTVNVLFTNNPERILFRDLNIPRLIISHVRSGLCGKHLCYLAGLLQRTHYQSLSCTILHCRSRSCHWSKSTVIWILYADWQHVQSILIITIKIPVHYHEFTTIENLLCDQTKVSPCSDLFNSVRHLHGVRGDGDPPSEAISRSTSVVSHRLSQVEERPWRRVFQPWFTTANKNLRQNSRTQRQ